MQAAPGHDVGFATKDSSGYLFHVHQLEKPERPLRMVKEQIDIRVFTCLASRRRAEQVEMLDAKSLQLGFVLLELGNGFTAFHRLSHQQYLIILCSVGNRLAQSISSSGHGGSPSLRRIS
jgi:hypothetical protein